MTCRALWLLLLALFTGGLPAAADTAWYEDVASAYRLYQGARSDEERRAVLDLLDQALADGVPADRLGEVQFFRGQTAFEVGDAATAVVALREAVALDPELPEYRLWLAHAYDLDQRTTLAVKTFRGLLADPLASPEERAAAAEGLAALHEPVELARLEPQSTLVVPGAVIRHHAGEPFAAVVRDALGQARRRLSDLLGIEVEEPIEVVLFADPGEYRDYHAARELPRPEWSTACTVNGRIFTYPAAGQRDRLLSTLTHEYTHVALRSVTDDRLPPCWIDEGLAVLVSEQFPNHRSIIARAPALLSMSALLVPTFGVYEKQDAYLAYAQSKAMVEDLLARYGAPRLREFLVQLGQHGDAAAAFQAVYGTSFEAYLEWWRVERASGR